MASRGGFAFTVMNTGRLLIVVTIALGLSACGPSSLPLVADEPVEKSTPGPSRLPSESSAPTITQAPPEDAEPQADKPGKETPSSPPRYAEELIPLTDVFCTETDSSKAIVEEIRRRCGIDVKTMARLQDIVRGAYAGMLVACPPVFGHHAESVDYTRAFHIVEDMNCAIRTLLGKKYPQFVKAFNEGYLEWQTRMKEEYQRKKEIEERLLQESQGKP